MATQIQALPTSRPLWRRALLPLAVLGMLALTYFVARALPVTTNTFPSAWNLGLRAQIDTFQDWVIGHRATHPIFVYFFQPVSFAIDLGMRWAEDVLLTTPWVVVIAVFGALGYLLSGVRLTLLCVVGLLLVGMFGLWEQSMQTLALMCVSVLFALLIGIPLGILAAANDRFDRLLRPILDGMQTMPAFVYLIPVLLFFGVARVPAVIATLIYAVPPAIRLTSLGIPQANPPAVEAAQAFGSTRRPLLFKGQLPLALPALMTGVNPTIMMALGMVVIAAMIGAGGLGREVLVSLQRLMVGKALEAGLAIVFLAIILDRLSDALSRIDLSAPPTSRSHMLPRWLPARWVEPTRIGLRALRRLGRLPAELFASRFRSSQTRQAIEQHAGLINSLLLIGLLLSISVILPIGTFPETWRLPISGPTDSAVAWMRDNLYQIGGLPIGTKPFSDFLTLSLLD